MARDRVKESLSDALAAGTCREHSATPVLNRGDSSRTNPPKGRTSHQPLAGFYVSPSEGIAMSQISLVFALCPLLFSPPMGPPAEPPPGLDPEIEVTKVAEGVYAVLRAQHPDEQPGHSNSVIIINDEDVVVVDATRMPSQARKILGVVRSLTDKPVRTLIHTHWHDDHVYG